jgi:hypothetical protein
MSTRDSVLTQTTIGSAGSMPAHYLISRAIRSDADEAARSRTGISLA